MAGFNIASLFSTAPAPAATPAPAPAPASATTPGNIPPGTGTNPGSGSPGTAANGTVPANGTGDGANSQEPSLEQFAKLWEPNAVDPNAPAPKNFFDLDPKALREKANQMDFTKMVNPEHFAKIAQGGEEAGKAFTSAMREFGSGMFAQNMATMTKVVEAALKDQKEQLTGHFNEQLKLHSVGEGLGSKNPAFNNPAVKPFVESIKRQLTEKHPNATPQELTAMAEQYFTAAASAFGGKKAADDGTGAGKRTAGVLESDFGEW